MRRGLFPGLLLIGIGAYLLASNFGMKVPEIGNMWPIFPTALGIFLLSEAMLKNREAAFPGTLFTLIGVFFFMFTSGYLPWNEMSRWWPAFPSIMGLSFFVLYLFKWEWGLLIPTGLFLGTGLVFFGINFGYLNENVLSYIWRLWPVVLILLGVSIIVNHTVKQKNQS